MARRTKPRVLVHCVANRYVGVSERIIEFSDGPMCGGLISFRRGEDGKLHVKVYRTDNVVVHF